MLSLRYLWRITMQVVLLLNNIPWLLPKLGQCYDNSGHTWTFNAIVSRLCDRFTVKRIEKVYKLSLLLVCQLFYTETWALHEWRLILVSQGSFKVPFNGSVEKKMRREWGSLWMRQSCNVLACDHQVTGLWIKTIFSLMRSFSYPPTPRCCPQPPLFYTSLSSSAIMDTIHNFPMPLRPFNNIYLPWRKPSVSILLNKEDLWGIDVSSKQWLEMSPPSCVEIILSHVL
jgi:hypothetical protein